jgi:glycosyltransferase involved in cell wall biosynthesis
MKNIRIGYVIGQLTYGGAERQLYELIRRIDRGKFQCFVYCLSEKTFPFGDKIKEAGAELRVLRRRHHFDIARVRELARLLRKDRIDIVHSFLFKANGYAWSACLLAGVSRLVTSARNCKEIGALRDWVNRLAFSASDAIICNGEAVRSFSARHFNIPMGKSVVIYNGIDLDRYRPAPTDGDGAGKPEDKLVITVGRLVPQKDLELFIEAAKLLDQEYKGARFLVVGDGPCRSDLMRCAEASGLDGKLTFAGERDDVPDLVAQAEVFWLTSRWEGLPNVLLEAMACGKPVVARDVGACRELIQHSETGFLVPERDAQTFAHYTMKLLSNPPYAREIGLAGRRKVEEKFSVAQMSEATQMLYHYLLQPKDSRIGMPMPSAY